jgi:copper chaperone
LTSLDIFEKSAYATLNLLPKIFNVPTMKSELHVSGMNCGGCEMLVKEALEELDGVSAAEASHLTGVVAVDFDPAKVTIAAITETIEAEGFKVEN